MKIITWNVNSIAARKDRLLKLLEREAPDALCLQELKCEESRFPLADVEALGYRAALNGQKTYNGVAILTKEPLADVAKGFDDGVADDHARMIRGRLGDVTIMSLYCPNGQAPGTDKYAYKLRWFERLAAYLARHHRPDEKLVLAGDFNVAPGDVDVHDPAAWHEQILCSTPEREALRQVAAFGLEDVYRRLHPEERAFSWWDYRMLAFPKNKGLRIDLILATASYAERCRESRIDRDERKGEKPSDHAPVVAVFA